MCGTLCSYTFANSLLTVQHVCHPSARTKVSTCIPWPYMEELSLPVISFPREVNKVCSSIYVRTDVHLQGPLN